MARLGRSQPFRWKQRPVRLSASVTVTPATGALTLTGYAPTITTPRAVVPATKALTLTAFAPTVSTPRVSVPATASLALTRYAPSVSAPRVVTPATAALTLTGYAPTVETPRVVVPATAALTLTGFAPTVASPRAVVPATAALILTSYAPDVAVGGGSVTSTPGTASLTLTGYPPDVTATETPAPADTRTITGIPVLKPRRRPQVGELAGVGYVASMGTGTLTGEAAIRGELLQDAEGYGHLVRETFRVLVAQIRTGAESAVTGEYASRATGIVAPFCYGRMAGEQMASGSAAMVLSVYVTVASERMVGGRLPVPSGGEAAITGQENDEALIFAATAYLTRRITAH